MTDLEQARDKVKEAVEAIRFYGKKFNEDESFFMSSYEWKNKYPSMMGKSFQEMILELNLRQAELQVASVTRFLHNEM